MPRESTVMYEFSPENPLDRDMFASFITQAAASSTPTYICDIRTPPGRFEQYCFEGRARAEANARMRGKAWRPTDQVTPGQALTVDELGRVGEGYIEEMLAGPDGERGLDVAPVLADSTDDRPDKTLNGLKFDVKAANPRPGDSFAVPIWQVASKGFDALLLVQHIEPGLARVWCCRCKPEGGAWRSQAGVRGKKPFWRIECTPAPAD